MRLRSDVCPVKLSGRRKHKRSGKAGVTVGWRIPKQTGLRLGDTMSMNKFLTHHQNRWMTRTSLGGWLFLVTLGNTAISTANPPEAARSTAIAQASTDDPSSSKDLKTDQDFAKRLPRVPPRSPAESLAAIRVHPDFRVELVASEPLIRDPVAVEFDAQGRMYVVELPQYNAYALKDVKLTGSVRLVVDRDGDGQYDTSSLFLDGLKYPTAVTCFDGGVFVGDAPDLLYAKDTDGDGRADVRRVIYTGFGSDKAGEAHLNSFRW